MHLLTKSIAVKNKHNETVSLDLATMKTLGMRTFKIGEASPTFLVAPKFRYTVNAGTPSEFYIDENQLAKAFTELPKAKVGERYRVLQDTKKFFKMVNSSPGVEPLKKGEVIVCVDNFMFVVDGKEDSFTHKFSVDETVDGCYYGSQVYYNPMYYALVE
jgi:hypothetical protein